MSFHEATVTAFIRNGDTVRVSLEGTANAAVFVHGVTEILIDGVVAHSVDMELPDGEVLTLDIDPGRIELIVRWNDFAKHISRTRSYRLSGRVIEVRDGASEALFPSWMRGSLYGLLLAVAALAIGGIGRHLLQGNVSGVAMGARLVATGLFGLGLPFSLLFLMTTIAGALYAVLYRRR